MSHRILRVLKYAGSVRYWLDQTLSLTGWEMTSTIETIATLIGDAKRIVVFTGAGISVESGIPTFRDPLTGIWARHDPGEA